MVGAVPRTSTFMDVIMTCRWTLNNRLGFPRSRHGLLVSMVENLLLLTVRCPVRSLVTAPTELYAIPTAFCSEADI
jgi:hypothetical protein